MTPQRFPESNATLGRPADMTSEECGPLPVCIDGRVVVSAWRPTPAELVRINLGEPVWLIVWGVGMPPVALTVDSPFEEPPANG